MRWLAVCAVLFLVTACSPERGGMTGVSVDDEGRLLTNVAWCGAAPDGLSVHRVPEAGVLIADAEYVSPPLRGGFASVSLEAPADGWRISFGDPGLDPGQTYSVSVWSKANSRTFGSVKFTPDAIRRMRPGLILIRQHDEKTGDEVDVVLGRADFVAQAQQDCVR
ncbi:hypothetical protein [Planomonospora venezuelensis]|uniref:Uncharacterized protein n=1 Tax=Planomonospora venezuelensis TaxID=1999 RepID=A0A841CX46_PLAVE|nr:hypothetical protein [Planomonospora venezuelensis]MBB5962982.1 hypothetical protein [Planomonospora venezuelensis]